MSAATLDHVLRARRDKIRALGVDLVGVVASLAREEAREDSDVDIVFDPAPGLAYWRLGALIRGPGTRFGRRVDLDGWMTKSEQWAWMSRDFIALI